MSVGIAIRMRRKKTVWISEKSRKSEIALSDLGDMLQTCQGIVDDRLRCFECQICDIAVVLCKKNCSECKSFSSSKTIVYVSVNLFLRLSYNFVKLSTE